jgi:hypothetical protein
MIARLRAIDCADAFKSYYSRDSEAFEVELPGMCRDTETSATPNPSRSIPCITFEHCIRI